MPRLEPFAGLRYDTARVDMDMVVAPPYDVVDAAHRDALARRHSANAVRVELPEPDHKAGLDRYDTAAATLASWVAAGTVRADPAPSLYAYRMTGTDGRATTGVIGALGIDAASAATVLPHEQTLSAPKSDRLDLLRATRANLSPIWGLSLTSGLTATFSPDGAGPGGPPAAAATDDDGVRHELWVIDDPAVIEAVQAAVAASPVVVADGHHRYETARTYLDEVGGNGNRPGADAVMALVVELSDDQLAVGAVHRVLSGLPDGLDLVDAFSSWFDVTKVGEPTQRTVAALGESQALALVMPSGAWLLAPKDGTPEAAGAPLDSAMVALVIAELPDHELVFSHTWQEAATLVAAEEAQAAVFLRPVTVDQIAEWAHQGRRMPPKTTYFHPKPRSGMVYRSLDA